MAKLALFDLDNTLIKGDSDHLWGEYLCQNNLVDAAYYQAQNEYFYSEYKNGTLNIDEFLAFTLKVLAENPVDQLLKWREQFLNNKITPIILPKALEAVRQHQANGDTTLIITATNYFITAPIAERFMVDDLLAVKPELENGQYTGNYIGTPTFREGKVTCLKAWLSKHTQSFEHMFFYSDSHNDLPLLEAVDTPIAVDPDNTLKNIANKRGWRITTFR